ncbi:MAG: hypothetical protein ACTSSJ_07070 [Candidatus Odinarchaeia archaeon]
MPIEYVCAICGAFKSPYESFFCPICQEIICNECAKSKPVGYQCSRCGWHTDVKIAHEYLSECPFCFICPLCENDLELVSSSEGFFYRCYFCGWDSRVSSPNILCEDRNKAYLQGYEKLFRKRLFEKRNVYCVKCGSILASRDMKNINIVARVFPKVSFKNLAIMVGTDNDILYTVENTRSDGCRIKFEWFLRDNICEINLNTKTAKLDFHPPSLNTPKKGVLKMKGLEKGETYLYGEMTYDFDEVILGSGKIQVRVGPITICPNVKVERIIPKSFNDKKAEIGLFISNNSEEIISKLIAYERITWEKKTLKIISVYLKDLKPGETKTLTYEITLDKETTYLLFNGLKFNVRFSKFMPTKFFEFTSLPIKIRLKKHGE